MKRVIISILITCLMLSGCKKKKVEQERLCSRIDIDRITSLIQKTSAQVDQIATISKQNLDKVLQDLDDIPAAARTYHNSLLPYEQAYFEFFTNKQILYVLAQLSDNSALQTEANIALLEMEQYESDVLMRNVTLYQVLQEYEHSGADDQDRKSKPIMYFVDQMLKKFRNQGMNLPVDQRSDTTKLEREVSLLEGRFYSNCVHDERHLIVSKQDLQGVPENFLLDLLKDEHGNYILPSDDKTFFTIMENCFVEQTRQSYYLMFGQKGYPQNKPILEQLIKSRNDLAQVHGFANFAAYQLHDLSIKSAKRADNFLWSMVKDVQLQDDRDFKTITAKLPPSVQLVGKHMLKPWDEALVKSWYRKQHFNIDDHALAEYFPLDHVLTVILKYFSRFFHVAFEPQPSDGLWAPDVQCYRVRSMKHQGVIGYLFFDLYSRSCKRDQGEYHLMMVPALRDDCSIPCVGASVVVANFKPSTPEQPTLLEFSDVISLLHEMGHGMHAIFGATRFTLFSGTQVVHDFIEVPSQMLEYWFNEPEFLHDIGHHFKTGKSLDRGTIEQLIAAQKFGQAGRMLKQLFLSLVSLDLFQTQHGHDVHAMIEKTYKKVFKHLAYEPSHYVELSFLHLSHPQYGAAYYTYPWSQVIAADLFMHIKQRGVFNHDEGERYVTEILSPGGSRHPSEMIKRYLGRSFSRKAYFDLL